MRIFIILSLALFFCGCDPAIRIRPENPDKTIDVKSYSGSKSRKADVYISHDKTVELQIIGAGGMIGSPGIEAIVFNKGASPIQIEPGKSYLKMDDSTVLFYPDGASFEGCTAQCKTTHFNLNPGEQKRIGWIWSGRLPKHFVFEFGSIAGKAEEIHVQFHSCGLNGSSC